MSENSIAYKYTVWPSMRGKWRPDVTDREIISQILSAALNNPRSCAECRYGMPPHDMYKDIRAMGSLRVCLVERKTPSPGTARSCPGFIPVTPLRLWREAKGLTRAELAEKLGIKAISLAAYELNMRKMGIDNLKRYAAALDISPEDLLEVNNAR